MAEVGIRLWRMAFLSWLLVLVGVVVCQAMACGGASPEVRRLLLPSPLPSGVKENDMVPVLLYVPEHAPEERLPAVVILHSWGGKRLTTEKALARRLIRHGIAAAIPDLPYQHGRRPQGVRHPQDRMISGDLQQTRIAFAQAIADVRNLIAYLRNQPEIDATRIGLAGVSLGAIISVLVMAEEKDICCGVLMLGSADLPLLLQRSPILLRVRRQLRNRGIRYEDVPSRVAPIEPAQAARQLRDTPILMVNALHDWVVPRRCVAELREALGNPPILWLNSSHYSAQVRRGPILDRVARFLDTYLHQPDTPLPQQREQFDSGLVPKIALVHIAGIGTRWAILFEVTRWTGSETVEGEAGVSPAGILCGIKATLVRYNGVGVADMSAGVRLWVNEPIREYLGISIHF